MTEDKKIEEKPTEDKTSPEEHEKQLGEMAGEDIPDSSEEVKPVFMTREMREQERLQQELANWVPKTEIGRLVKSGKIKNIDEIIEKNIKILESEIVDTLLNTNSDLIAIGQFKGKFGGGKRRAWKQTQKKTEEGNVMKFSAMAVIGDSGGRVGIGMGSSKETLPARAKAVRKAKLNIIKIKRGCGSFDCVCHENHSIPFTVEGKCGSVKIKLIPAPQGTGLVTGSEVQKILKAAGIKDIYTKTSGHIRTTVNLVKACVEALKKTNKLAN